MLLFIISFIAGIFSINIPKYRPVVLLHGITKDSHHMDPIQSWIEETYPGIYVHNAEIGNGVASSMLMNLVKQGNEFYKAIVNDKEIVKAGEVDFICHSMGGLTCRNFIQNYQDVAKIRVHNAIFLSTPNAGFFCNKQTGCPWKIPESVYDLIENNVYLPIAQQGFSATNMWKDPLRYETYLENNIFFPSSLDNEIDPDIRRKQNLLKLNMLILTASPNDGLITPWQSSHFGYVKSIENGIVEFIQMTDSDFYKNDTFGLRTLDETGRLKLIMLDCQHTWYMSEEAKEWMIENIIKKYIGMDFTEEYMLINWFE